MGSEQLVNLQRIGQIEPIVFSATFFQKLLVAAESRLQDALRKQNSFETRFDCAYTAIRAVADAALLMHGFRTSTSKPGHHQTTLQCLVHTLGIDGATVRVLDGLRKQRNLSEYDGEMVTQAALDECIHQAQALLAMVKQLRF